MIPECTACVGTGKIQGAIVTPCRRCGGSGVEPLEAASAQGDEDGQELPEWLTSTHAECPDPSFLGRLLDPAGVNIEWPCGLYASRMFSSVEDRDLNFQALHDEALARAEHELRLQRGVVTMRASRISSGPTASGGFIAASGGFAAPMAPTYDFPATAIGEAGVEAAMPVMKAGRGSITMEMTVTDEGASWIKQLWERGAVSHREARRRS